MSTPVLGPLVNGTRLQFAIEYDLPSSIDESYGDILITDNLPLGLSWYSTSNTDHKNKVIIGQIQKIANITFNAIDRNIVIKIPNSILIIPDNKGKKLYIDIDAVISDATAIEQDTSLINNASFQFTAIDLKASGNADFMLTTFTKFAPQINKYPRPFSGYPFAIMINMITSSNTEYFKYDIMLNFGENLIFDPLNADNYELYTYGDGKYQPVTVTKDSGFINAYHFIFANTPDITGNIASLTVIPTTKYGNESQLNQLNNTVTPDSILFSYSIQIGGAQAIIENVSVPISKMIALNKSVVDSVPEI